MDPHTSSPLGRTSPIANRMHCARPAPGAATQLCATQFASHKEAAHICTRPFRHRTTSGDHCQPCARGKATPKPAWCMHSIGALHSPAWSLSQVEHITIATPHRCSHEDSKLISCRRSASHLTADKEATHEPSRLSIVATLAPKLHMPHNVAVSMREAGDTFPACAPTELLDRGVVYISNHMYPIRIR